MDDSAANNLFNDPITGADKNEDFLVEGSHLAPAHEARAKIENPEGKTGGKEKGHRAKSHEKAQESGRNRTEHPAAAASDKDRKVQRTTSELADIGAKTAATEKLSENVEEAKGVQKFLQKLSNTIDYLHENGGDILRKQVLPVAGLLAIVGVAMYVDRTGSGLAQVLAAGLSGGMEGWAEAATDEESRLVSGFREKRGLGEEEEAEEKGTKKEEASQLSKEAEGEDDSQDADTHAESQLPTESEGQGDKKRKIDLIQVADHVTAAALGAAGTVLAGEAAFFTKPAQTAIGVASAVDHGIHFLEGKAAKVINNMRRETPTEAQLHAAGTLEPRNLAGDNQNVNTVREITSSEPESAQVEPTQEDSSSAREDSPSAQEDPSHVVKRAKKRLRGWVNGRINGPSSGPADNRPSSGPGNDQERSGPSRPDNKHHQRTRTHRRAAERGGNKERPSRESLVTAS